jgi:two-component system sensor histidine kinase VicK
MHIKSVSRNVFSTKTRLDIFGDFRNFEMLSTNFRLFIKDMLDSKDKITTERRYRYIIEITKENIDYCKELMKICELRHLDNLKGNFVLYENKYSFISTNIKYQIDGNKKEECDNNAEVSIVNISSTENVNQQQELFDTFWNNSLPADKKIRELEKERKRSLDTRCNDFNKENLATPGRFDNDDINNIVKMTRDDFGIKSLLMSGIYSAKSEILLTIGLLVHFRYFWKIGLHEGLKHAIEKGVRTIILYPEDGNSDITKKDVTNLVSNAGENVHLRGVSGPIGTVMIIDSAKIILIDNEKENKSTDNDIFGLYSNNKSVISNFGSLFDTLLNEKEVLDYAIETKIQLESSNKQLKESNQRLKTNSELQLEFINLAAHEIRTPTQAILGYIELLQTSDIKDVSNLNYLNSIERNANRLARLVEDLTYVSKIESNKIVLLKEKTNLKNLIEFVIKDFKIDLQRRSRESKRKGDERYLKNIDILSSCNLQENENSLPVFEVMIDPIKIIQVLSNLINNSLHSIYNDNSNIELNGNSVRIIITKITNIDVAESDNNNSHPDLENKILITIKDTGKGIEPKLFPSLFEKFVTNSSSGTGLGLYITKAIIEAHGGRIWAENNKNEKGATFRFTLPLT